MRDYPLHELSAQDFQNLIILICEKILGIATINFSEGPDGGRDGFFEGTANNFPSQSKPWKGKFIIQAKKTLNQNASCSDADFKYLIENKEVPKIKKLYKKKEVDNYILFTNRKLSANKYAEYKKFIQEKTGVSNVEIIGIEKLRIWLNEKQDIARIFDLDRFRSPLRFHPEEFKEILITFHENLEDITNNYKSQYNFEFIGIEKKNEINNLSETYFDYIKDNSESYFNDIHNFIKDPKNKEYADFYFNVVDELQGKITIRREEFHKFEEIFEYIYDEMLYKFPDLKNRKLINAFLHYMYCNCDIGVKC
jgi:hypothetical protein